MSITSISKQFSDTIKFFGMCFVFFFPSMYLNSAHRQEVAGYRFKGTQRENKSSFHIVKVNVEF